MARLRSLATYVPVWGTDKARVIGPDEDSVTMAVAAGRLALANAQRAVESVVVVSRDFTNLEGGGEAVIVAGLDLPADTRCMLVLGGAPATLDAVTGAGPNTLVIGVDTKPAAAGAVVVGAESDPGVSFVSAGRVERSLPTQVRDNQGEVFDYADPRLVRVRGVGVALSRLDLGKKPVAIAGLSAKEAAGLIDGPAGSTPSTGSSSVLFTLAEVLPRTADGLVVAVEQGTAAAGELSGSIGAVDVTVHRAPARALPKRRPPAAADIKISLAAYERAFDGKIRLAAGKCSVCGTLDLPQRYRCSNCGAEQSSSLAALPRDATVYTAVSIHVPVPGLLTPYDLAIVDLGSTGVRLMTPVADADAGAVGIGDTGTVVLRLIATRNGVQDYGYAFVPDPKPTSDTLTGTSSEGVAV